MTLHRFPVNETVSYYQALIKDIYEVPCDRNFSVPDLISQIHRFTMRALKGIRKDDRHKLVRNLFISLCWAMILANRFRIDVEEVMWQRFPMLCSYCGTRPCSCKRIKPKKRKKIFKNRALKPKRVADFQAMFEQIYPAGSRTLQHAGVHLGEEMGEVAEAVHNFLGEHRKGQLVLIEEEVADYLSCVFSVANSANINVAQGIHEMFEKNCFVCHQLPCSCSFSTFSRFKS
jgi:NTP pyrophosphatase (non-canonical NTP hydrolase)